MTRYTFGGSAADFVIQPPSLNADHVLSAPSRSGSAWSAQSGGMQYTDLIAVEGSSPPSTDVNGWLNQFQGPDSITQVWLQFSGTDRFLITAVDAPIGGGGGGGGGGGSDITISDNGDGTIHVTDVGSSTAYDVPTTGLDGLQPGSAFMVYKVGTGWNYPGPTGSVITTRPTSRTDLTMFWSSPDGTAPPFALSMDKPIPSTAADVSAAPLVLASGASTLRFVGRGPTLPATGTTGDVFFKES